MEGVDLNRNYSTKYTNLVSEKVMIFPILGDDASLIVG